MPRRPPRLLSPREVAFALGLRPRTIVGWLRAGLLRGIRLGRVWRINEREIDRLIYRGYLGRPATMGTDKSAAIAVGWDALRTDHYWMPQSWLRMTEVPYRLFENMEKPDRQLLLHRLRQFALDKNTTVGTVQTIDQNAVSFHCVVRGGGDVWILAATNVLETSKESTGGGLQGPGKADDVDE